PPLRKRAARVQSESELVRDRDRQRDTPPTTSPHGLSDTQRETEDGSSSVRYTTALGAESVTRAADTEETHKTDSVAMTTDPTSETESHESTDEDTEDSAACGDVSMDGESEESEWEGSESSSSEEESDRGALEDSVLLSKNPEAVALGAPPTETTVSFLTPHIGVDRSLPPSDSSRVTSIPDGLGHQWEIRLGE
ncbi:hypothetical protein KIPB_016131, partial [Kipferlia bialata]